MRKIIIVCLVSMLILTMTACAGERSTDNKIEGNMKTYYEMDDGTWMCDDISYEYRLEITGKVPNAAKDTTYVYLSNLENITFEQAWKASGLSSLSTDYFSLEDAVLVEWR